VAVDRVTLSGPVPASAWASVRRLDPGSASGASFDVVVSAGGGEPCLVLRGLRLAPVDRRAFRRTGSDLGSFEVRWHPAPAGATAAPRPWLVTGPDPDGVRDWVDQLAAAGLPAAAVPWASGAGPVPEGDGVPGLLIRAGLPAGGTTDPAGTAERLGTDGLEVLRDHLARYAAAGPTVVLCSTGGATPTPPGGRAPLSDDDLGQSVVTGLAKAVIAEYPQVRCVQVDLDPDAAAPPVEELLARVAGSSGSGHLAVRQGRWWEAGLVAEPVAGPADVKIRADGTYLVTGGFGALGGRVAEWLVQQGARTLLLLGRSLPADRPDLPDALRAAGVRVEALAGDVADGSTLTAVDERLAGMPPLRGIVHAAGVRDDAPLEHLDRTRVEQVLRPKVRGGWLIHQLAERHEPDLVVLFSSLASVTGSAGQANYVLANTFLDGLATYRRQRGLPAVSVSWGPWAGAGMAGDAGAALGRSGLRGLAPAEALDALGEVLGRAAPHVAVAAVDWGRHPAAGPHRETYTLLTGVLTDVLPDAPAPAAGTGPTPTADELAALVVEDPDQARQLVESLVADRVGVLLGWSRAQQADNRPTFGQLRLGRLGIDSLMAVQLRNQLLGELAVDLPSHYLLGDHSVQDVVETVVRQLTLRRMTAAGDGTDGDDVEVLIL
jgi:NAD(P)-dependent dehydrogenase (short-subunit alcohol dehydrogenase family)